MIKFIRDYFMFLMMILFLSFYLAYFVTVNYEIVSVHRALLNNKKFDNINFGFMTFVIFSCMPWLIHKMTVDSEIPILKNTEDFRLILSRLSIVFTVCLFVSKSIFNSIAKDVMSWESSIILGLKGRIVLVEILSLAVPLVLFLYLSKKVVSLHSDKEELGG